MKKKFFIVDVFTHRKYAGNQLAVFTDARSISSEEMQQIARETNFSETTFIVSDPDASGSCDVRIFTPKEEIPFAGHPTLGTAFIIQKALIQEPVGEVVLNLGVGPIPVSIDHQSGILKMKQNGPRFGDQIWKQLILMTGIRYRLSPPDCRR
jgi:trans-2,3-dihydro-3-hydroxyanthranilate isomerase